MVPRLLKGAVAVVAAAVVAAVLVLVLHNSPPDVTTNSDTAAGASASASTAPAAQPTTTAATTVAAQPTTTAAAQPPRPHIGPASPHFDTPEAAMVYLASAWNRGDTTELDHVTNPAARQALNAMHDEAVNLRLNHCTPRPGMGDYFCYFDHDYPAGTSTTLPGGVGHSVFIVAPALTPGWYMTVLQSCG